MPNLIIRSKPKPESQAKGHEVYISLIATPNRGLSTLMTNDVPFEMSGEVMWTKQQCTWVQEVAMHEDTVQHS
jgi:hypothetical protein